MRGHASHGIIEVFPSSLACVRVYDRIGSDHVLIHAVECKALAIGAPEESPLDAELILMYGEPVDE